MPKYAKGGSSTQKQCLKCHQLVDPYIFTQTDNTRCHLRASKIDYTRCRTPRLKNVYAEVRAWQGRLNHVHLQASTTPSGTQPSQIIQRLQANNLTCKFSNGKDSRGSHCLWSASQSGVWGVLYARNNCVEARRALTGLQVTSSLSAVGLDTFAASTAAFGGFRHFLRHHS